MSHYPNPKDFHAMFLRTHLDIWLKDSRYFVGSETWEDGSPKLWCNIAARDFLDSRFKSDTIKGGFYNYYNFDLSCINSIIMKAIRSTPIKSYLEKIVTAYFDDKLRLVSWSEAIDIAGYGIPIHVINPQGTHEAILHPNSHHYHTNYSEHIYVAQHGVKSGIFKITDPWSFNVGGASELIYILYKEMEGV